MQNGNKNDLQLASRDLFERYSTTVIDLIQIPDEIERNEFIAKCENDFEKILDFIEMKDLGVNPMEIINKYDLNLASYISGINNSARDPTKYINIIRILSHLKMPVELETLSALCEIDESELLSTIHNDLNSIVWTFKKRSSLREAVEEDKYNDAGDDEIYIVVNSINYFEYENSVEVHNEIVKLLRKNSRLSHYLLFWVWYHISEWDDDYTKDYMEEEEHKIEPTNINNNKDDIQEDAMEDKSQNVTFFDLYDKLFKSKVIYEFIKYHRSFEFLINEIGYVICSHQTDIIEKERAQLLNFRNILYLIE